MLKMLFEANDVSISITNERVLLPVCLSVCLHAHVSQKPRAQISRNFL